MSNNTTSDTCPICNGHGRISNGRDPCDPAYDDGPCPHPDCEDGVIERPAPIVTSPAKLDMVAYANALLRGVSP